MIAGADLAVRLTRPDQLSVAEQDLWSRLQPADPELDGPFFCLELIQAVGRVRPDLEVAVIERGGEVLGFFPFQRGAGNVGRPALSRLSEFQGFIMPRGVSFDAADLLRQCRLVAWHFDHLVASQLPLQPYHWSVTGSPVMDLSRGYQAYESQRRQAGSSLLASLGRKSRKCAREVGPLRFEFHSRDPAVFRALIDWKTRQHEQTNRFRVLDTPWLIELLEDLQRVESPRFSAVLSALYAGDRLLAVHYGLSSPASVHIWFPAFHPDYSRYSPGLLLFVELAKAAADRGIRRVDLGKGPERYKIEFMTGAATIAEGSFDTRPAHRWARLVWHRANRWLTASPNRAVLALPLEWSRRWRQRRAFGQ